MVPTNKHYDNWIQHCFHINRHFDLVLVIFLNIVNIIRFSVSSNKTLRYGTFFSNIFRALKLKVHVDLGRASTFYFDISASYSCDWIKRDS